MKVRIYRNLDRSFDMFGIKGNFIPMAGVMLLAIILLSIIIGSIAGTFFGLASAFILIVSGYLFMIEFQHRFGSKNLRRKLISYGLPHYIIINIKTWKK